VSWLVMTAEKNGRKLNTSNYTLLIFLQSQCVKSQFEAFFVRFLDHLTQSGDLQSVYDLKQIQLELPNDPIASRAQVHNQEEGMTTSYAGDEQPVGLRRWFARIFPKPTIFISYAREDVEFAVSLLQRFDTRGVLQAQSRT
jgi:hypothetical protein